MANESESMLESISPEEIEEIENIISAEDIETFSEETEEESIEATIEEVEGDLESVMEGAEAATKKFRLPAPYVQFHKRFVRLLVKSIRNGILQAARDQRKKQVLQKLCRQGPTATCKYLCRSICVRFPVILRPLCAYYCQKICRRLFPWICRTVNATKVVQKGKAKAESIEEVEYWEGM
jgi:hypothetical protein